MPTTCCCSPITVFGIAHGVGAAVDVVFLSLVELGRREEAVTHVADSVVVVSVADLCVSKESVSVFKHLYTEVAAGNVSVLLRERAHYLEKLVRTVNVKVEVYIAAVVSAVYGEINALL